MNTPPGFHAPSRRRTRPTPVGWAVLAVAAMALFVPGVRLFAAALLAVVLVAVVRVRRSLSGLRIASPEPAAVLVGEALELEFPVTNAARLVAARDVTFHQVPERGSGLRVAYYLADLAPRANETLRPVFRHFRRGRLTRHGLVAITSYPFGIALSLAEFEVPVDLLVLPRPGRARHLARLLADRGFALATRRSVHTPEGDYLGLREWREGESHRLVHWKATARRGRPIVRELASEDARPVHVILATGTAHLPDSVRSDAALERAIQTAATLLDGLLREGRRVRLSVCGKAGAVCAVPVRGTGAVRTLLVLLAEVAPDDGPPRFDAAGAPPGRLEAELCLASGEEATDPPALPSAGAVLLFADAPDVRRHFPSGAAPPRGVSRRTRTAEVRS